MGKFSIKKYKEMLPRSEKRANVGIPGLLSSFSLNTPKGTDFWGSALKGVGESAIKAVAASATDALIGAVKRRVANPAQAEMIFEDLRRTDEIISQMEEDKFFDAKRTILRTAPLLSEDKNAVRSVLRVAAQSEGGMDYQTIAGLARAEADLKKSMGA